MLVASYIRELQQGQALGVETYLMQDSTHIEDSEAQIAHMPINAENGCTLHSMIANAYTLTVCIIPSNP